MGQAEGLQIIVCSGPEDARRATAGFAAALSASESGIAVTVFLVMDGVRWALKSEGNTAQVSGFPAVGQLLEMIGNSGGRIEICSTCAEGACSFPLEVQPHSMLRPGVIYGGLVSVAIRMTQVPTVTF